MILEGERERKRRRSVGRSVGRPVGRSSGKKEEKKSNDQVEWRRKWGPKRRKGGRREGGIEAAGRGRVRTSLPDSRVGIEAGGRGDQCHSNARDAPISFGTLGGGPESGPARREVIRL